MENVTEIFTDKIAVPKDNMRQHIDRDAIFELAEDIKKNGLISPITVRPVGDGYELVAGQRRYLAHQFSGILKIKCIVKTLSDDEAFAIMTSENLARVDVNPVDEARHVGRLMEKNNNDIEKVAHIVGRGSKWIEDRIAVASMPDYMQDFLAKKEIKLGVALILNEITDENTRQMWTFQAVRDGVNIEMAKYWLQDFKRQLLPGGSLSVPGAEQTNFAPPSAIMFRCAIDGQEYDTRFCKSIIIYEGNAGIFNEFALAFRSPPPETDLIPGGD